MEKETKKRYKGYDSEVGRLATNKYIHDKTKQITLRYKNEDFEQKVLPYVQKSGMPMITFIKQAVAEKIARDFGVDSE